jgi:hypothetical protein
MTSVEQQDARLIAMDAASVAAIRLHAPEFEAAYLADDVPFWFECLLDRCVASAECIADEYWSDPAFIQAYATALPELLGRALASAGPLSMALASMVGGTPNVRLEWSEEVIAVNQVSL